MCGIPVKTRDKNTFCAPRLGYVPLFGKKFRKHFPCKIQGTGWHNSLAKGGSQGGLHSPGWFSKDAGHDSYPYNCRYYCHYGNPKDGSVCIHMMGKKNKSISFSFGTFTLPYYANL